MSDRLRIFGRGGSLFAEFNAAVSRSWIIGGRSSASFTISTGEDYCNETVLNFGNWVVVESTQLPAWVGTIASREWRGDRTITIAAFSPEWLLSQRIGPIEKIITASAGEIFVEIIRQANSDEQTLIRAGEIYIGEDMQETLNPLSLDKDLNRIYERSGEEYAWRVSFNPNGQLIVYGDWFDRLGADTNFFLREGKGGGNIESGKRVLVEDAPRGNYLFGYGNGLTWKTKPYSIAEDSTSQNRYGLIQQSISYYGLTTKAAITKNVNAELKKRKNPSSVYSVTAIDSANTFPYLVLGNTMYLSMENIGFTTGNLGTLKKRVRIMGMFYNPIDAGKIDLALYSFE